MSVRVGRYFMFYVECRLPYIFEISIVYATALLNLLTNLLTVL